MVYARIAVKKSVLCTHGLILLVTCLKVEKKSSSVISTFTEVPEALNPGAGYSGKSGELIVAVRGKSGF